jgi:hypothetical protein
LQYLIAKDHPCNYLIAVGGYTISYHQTPFKKPNKMDTAGRSFFFMFMNLSLFNKVGIGDMICL